MDRRFYGGFTAMGNPEQIIKAGEATRFSSDNQPEDSPRNTGPISKYLREIGDATELVMTLKITKPDKNGVPTTKESTHRIETIGGATIKKMLATRLYQQAINGDTTAAKIILDRTEGRVPQQLNLGNSDGSPLDIRDMSSLTIEQLRAIANGEA
ncbi:hypothetical protein FAES_3934 [Fibrella aestuarina BUZ 2]|uniref:Uncharacterized protein n=1 Tax=Fibrella aestuarina BUZ 2 TaxID=1166018 RepID=I0KCT7_9BACT|nr:hypothetical protein [Fibrella aestuarina]CCH01940.1 hypothetical protein FAES_3934 [Fibrella aestuarina BUZ 2]